MKYYAFIKNNLITDVRLITNNKYLQELRRQLDIDNVIEVEDDGYKNGVYINRPYRSINEFKEDLFKQVDEKRNELIAEGVQYLFPDGITGRIQTRNQIDERNIQANSSAAQTYILLEKPNEEMLFRDAEDNIHSMTAKQMLEMTLYIKVHGQTIYSRSWQIKDEINTLISQNKIDDLKNFKITF